jgi:hypothetical protein
MPLRVKSKCRYEPYGLGYTINYNGEKALISFLQMFATQIHLKHKACVPQIRKAHFAPKTFTKLHKNAIGASVASNQRWPKMKMPTARNGEKIF